MDLLKQEMTTEPLYWHFLPADGRMANTGELVEVGKTYRIEGEPVLCKRGLHASARALDALKYAPGPIICQVTLGGTVLHGDDKSVAQERTVLAMADATAVLHEFACRCAEWALALVEEPDPRSVEAITTKRRWLRGEATDDELAAAQVAAQTIAWAVARDAAWAVAQTTAWDAAWDAARAATRAAARAAAQATAWATAWDAARAAQNEQLETMLRVELGNRPAEGAKPVDVWPDRW